MKLKIIFFAPSLSIGGAERVLVNLIKKIDLNKFDVTLCLLSFTGAYIDEIPKQIKIIGIVKFKFVARSLIFLNTKFKMSFPLKVLTRLSVKEKYDVGISIDGQLTDVLLFVKDKIKKKIAWVHSCYLSEALLNKVYTETRVKWLVKSRYDLLDEIIFVSENSKNEFQKLFKSDKGVVISNIIDSESILTKSKKNLTVKFDQNLINIIAVGRLVEVKEYSKLIDAAQILVKKELKFKIRIVGDGTLIQQLKAQTIKLNLENYVELIGHTSNPYTYIKASDILVVTSSSEALPTVLFEAMILEVPIVATNCSGVLEITKNGQYALVAHQSVDDIAKKLELMMSDDLLRKQYAKRGLERMNDFNEEKILEQIYKIFKL